MDNYDPAQKLGPTIQSRWLDGVLLAVIAVLTACGLPGSLGMQPTDMPAPSPTATATYTAVPTFTTTPVLTPTPTDTSTPTLEPLLVAVNTPTIIPVDSEEVALSAPISPTETVPPTPAGPRIFSSAELEALVAQMCPRREACFMSPVTNSKVSGSVEFRGAANRPGFQFYKLEYRAEDKTTWKLIDIYERPVRLATLGYWQTADLPPGVYLVRLIVVDINGNYWPEEPTLRLIVE